MTYNNTIGYPLISPIRWVEPFSTARYVRRAGATDTWRVQFLSDNDLSDTFVLRAYSYNFGFYLCEFSFTKSTLSASKYYWDAYCDFSEIVEAIEDLGLHYLDSCVYFKIQVGTDVWADSLPVLIDSTGTKQISVWNTYNDFGTVFGAFDWSNLFSFRVEAKFDNLYYKMGGKYETFTNQIGEDTVFYSNPRGEYLLRIGDEAGLDDGMIEQIHRFFSCDTILIDFTHYVRGEITENVNEKNGTRYIDVILTRAENSNYQNVIGDVTYITNEDDNVIEAQTEDGDKLLIL